MLCRLAVDDGSGRLWLSKRGETARAAQAFVVRQPRGNLLETLGELPLGDEAICVAPRLYGRSLRCVLNTETACALPLLLKRHCRVTGLHGEDAPSTVGRTPENLWASLARARWCTWAHEVQEGRIM